MHFVCCVEASANAAEVFLAIKKNRHGGRRYEERQTTEKIKYIGAAFFESYGTTLSRR
jgi:hypothetical protein